MPNETQPQQINGATAEKLIQFVQRIERLESDKSEISADIRELMSEVRAFGFDTKIVRKLIKIRSQDPNEIAEEEMLLDLYMGVINGDSNE